MEKLSIDERLETAGQLVVRANIFLDIWEFYHGPSRGKILDAMNNYPSFFLFDEHAHRFSFIVHAAALFEKADTINLSQLARELHEAGAISDVAMAEIQQLFASVKRVSTGVHIIRSNAFAHRSASLSFNNAFEKAEISFDDLHGLMNVALIVINVLLVACGHDRKEFFTPPLNDARCMLSALSAYG
jgi:hypothetical protein